MNRILTMTTDLSIYAQSPEVQELHFTTTYTNDHSTTVKGRVIVENEGDKWEVSGQISSAGAFCSPKLSSLDEAMSTLAGRLPKMTEPFIEGLQDNIRLRSNNTSMREIVVFQVGHDYKNGLGHSFNTLGAGIAINPETVLGREYLSEIVMAVG